MYDGTRTLPTELLISIFEITRDELLFCSETDSSTNRSQNANSKRSQLATQFSIRISLVSKTWREIALDVSSLWSLIWIQGRRPIPVQDPRVTTFIERAKSSLLDFHFDRAGYLVPVILLKYGDRIRSLRIEETSCRESMYLNRSLTLRAPSLKELHMETPHEPQWKSIGHGQSVALSYPDFCLHGSFAPSLQRATLIDNLPIESQARLPAHAQTPWNISVVTMVIDMERISFHHLSSFLLLCPKLEHLELEETESSAHSMENSHLLESTATRMSQAKEIVRSELQVQLHQAKTFHNPIDAGLIPYEATY
ncbi:hypothetical protein FRC03_004516 [Tulasnella sp. 419]|nr:hypothetical protein FRC03_004516 [Tulasnella sp. 419]